MWASVVMLLCISVFMVCVQWSTVAQSAPPDLSIWDPRDPHELDLGSTAYLTTRHDTILVLVDTQFHVLVLKDLQKFTCFVLSLSPADVTSEDVLQAVEARGMAIIHAEYRPAAQLSRTEVGNHYGHRVAQFCLHNPTFLLDKAANTSPTPQVIGR